MNARLLGAATIAIVVAGCGDDLGYRFAGLVRVTGETPFVADCNGAPQPGEVAFGQEVEPFVAADPTQPGHLVGVWQQDRWSNGGANGLGTAVVVRRRRDLGRDRAGRVQPVRRRRRGGRRRLRALDRPVGDDSRPTAPSTRFGLAFDGTSRATPSWSAGPTTAARRGAAPTTLIADDDPDVFNDKESITADPTDADPGLRRLGPADRPAPAQDADRHRPVDDGPQGRRRRGSRRARSTTPGSTTRPSATRLPSCPTAPWSTSSPRST